MKKILTPEQLKRRRKINKRIILIFSSVIILLFIIGIFVPSDKAVSEDVKVRSINMDSIVSLIKKDTLEEIKEVYYNPKDSSLNIAITNRDNAIKDKMYEGDPTYFFETYHLDRVDGVEGVYIFACKTGKSLAKNEYKESLTYNSKKLAKLNNAFKEKYYDSYLGTYKPLYDYLKENLNDPSSLDITKSFFIGMNDDSTFEVKTIFRAKNPFGALMMHTVNCNIDMNGNVSNVKMDE